MNRKRILLLVSALALIAAAFAVPSLALRVSVRQMARTPTLLDASADTLTASENFVEKLACFNDPYAASVQIGFEGEPNVIAQALRDELHTLYKLGAIPFEFYHPIYSASYEGVYIDRTCMIQPELPLVFEVYTVHLLGANAMVLLDASSGKVLRLSYITAAESLLPLEYGDEPGTKELEGWAEYYGLSLGEITYTTTGLDELRRLDHPYAKCPMAVLKESRFTDSSGASVNFSLFYEFRENMEETYSWGPYS